MSYLTRFSEKSCDHKINAQRNLCGLCHYVDESTLKGFKSRIVDSGVADEGLLFWIVESIPDHSGKRVFRAVVFNMWGDVVNNREKIQNSHRTRKQANKSLWVDLESIDAVKCNLESCQRSIHNLAQQLKELVELSK